MSRDAFFEFCGANPDLRIERSSDGHITIMSPTGGETGRRESALIAQLYHWAKENGAGESFSSSTGFELPNGATRSPDASWIRRDRWYRIAVEERKRFARICPDFVLELRSDSDQISTLKAKVQEFIDNGATLGMLIDPIEKRVYIYRPGNPVELQHRPNPLSAEPEMPGLHFDMSDVW